VQRKVGNFFVTADLLAASVDQVIWIAPTYCRLVSVKEIHSVVGGASAAVRPRKVSGTSAPGAAASATVVELSAAADLTATINTLQTLTITAGSAARRFKPNDRLALDFSGTLTGLVGNISFEFEPL